MNADVNLMAENKTQNKNGLMIRVNLSVKKTTKKNIRHHVLQVDYAWKPNVCACECAKDYKITYKIVHALKS